MNVHLILIEFKAWSRGLVQGLVKLAGVGGGGVATLLWVQGIRYGKGSRFQGHRETVLCKEGHLAYAARPIHSGAGGTKANCPAGSKACSRTVRFVL